MAMVSLAINITTIAIVDVAMVATIEARGPARLLLWLLWHEVAPDYCYCTSIKVARKAVEYNVETPLIMMSS